MKEKPICVYVLICKNTSSDFEVLGTYSTYELAEKYKEKYAIKIIQDEDTVMRLEIYQSPFDYGEQ